MSKCATINKALFGLLERVLTFYVPIINPPFADISRLIIMPKNCAICWNYNWINLLKEKYSSFQQIYSQKLWKMK